MPASYRQGAEYLCLSTLWHSLLLSLRFLSFFFQAEDGIRDTSVTGVQTCALPIFRFGRRLLEAARRHELRRGAGRGRQLEGARLRLHAIEQRLRAGVRRDGRPEIGRASCRERVSVWVGARVGVTQGRRIRGTRK